MTRRLLAAGALAGIAGVAIAVFALADPRLDAGPVREARASTSEPSTGPRPVDRATDAEIGLVVVIDGQPIAATLEVRLGPQEHHLEVAPGVRATIPHQVGTAWVTARPERGRPRYFRFDIEEPRDLLLDLGASKSRAWITLYDWTTGEPLAGAALPTSRGGLRSELAPAEPIVTTAGGHAFVEIDAGERMHVSAPGATQGAPRPHAAQFLAPPAGPGLDHRIVLLTEPARWPVEVEATSHAGIGLLPPMLYAQRIDAGGSETIPFGTVPPGETRTFDLRLSRGVYRFDSCPPGDYRCSGPGSVSIGVAGDVPTAPIRLSLDPETERCALTLVGITRPELPIRVLSLDALRQEPDLDAAPWIGPSRWGRPSADVARCTEPRWLVSIGRTEQRISRQPVALGGAEVSVEMVRAGAIAVALARSTGDRDATLVVEGDGFECAQSLAPDWQAAEGRAEPVWSGRILAPYGELSLALFVGGQERLREMLHVETPNMTWSASAEAR